MTSSDCEITGGFGVIVQLLLGTLVLIVLGAEWLYEYFTRPANEQRNFQKFWLDTFKICTGAFLSHCVNVMVALYLTNNVKGHAETCSLYALSFYYECTGLSFVSLSQYCLVKYAQTKNSNFWMYLSRPGKYPGNEESNPPPTNQINNNDNINNKSVFNFPVDKRNEKCQITTVISIVFGVIIAVSVGMTMHSVFLGIGGGICGIILAFTTGIAPWSSRYQVLAWCGIKLFEKLTWAAFVLIQAKPLQDWSEQMTIKDKQAEAVLYLAIMPLILNTF
eukprot:UN32106